MKWIVVLSAGIALGLGAGTLRAPRPPARAHGVPCVEGVLDDLEYAERGSTAATEIVSDLVEGRSSTDETSLAITLKMLRDTMQELTGAIGNVRTQIEALRQSGRVAACGVPR